jgi:ribonucleotide monophosphatase NagD (HAD superfamily)
MVGDTLKDIEAGKRAGVRGILVRTGYGAESAAALESGEESLRKNQGKAAYPGGEAQSIHPAHIAKDILAAVRWLLKDRKT